MSTQTTTIHQVAIREDVAKPKTYKVVFVNDNVTTMDFVVAVLIEIFNHTMESALDITHKVHTDGSAVVAVLPYEIAEHKATDTMVAAKRSGFPLVVKIEEA